MRPEDSPDRVTQLERALAIAREMLEEKDRRHEAAERHWAAKYTDLMQRIGWLEAQVTADVVRQSKGLVQ